MPISIMMHLFSKPAIELGKEGEPIDAADVRLLADELHSRLRSAADAMDCLTGKGWDAQMALYDVILSHPYIDSEADARDRIEDLGLNPDDFCYLECEDEEWEDEDDLESPEA
jgi:hypothetical protein